jgi:two-component system, cell cycle response regulator
MATRRSGKQLDTLHVDVSPRSTRRKGVFTVVVGIDAGQVLSIPQGAVSTLGRAVECTFPFDDASLSREHAQVLTIGPDYVLQDAGSRNGSYVNDVRTTGPVKLKHGDRVQIGVTTILNFSLVTDEEEASLKRVYEAAVRDGLTGVYNRKHLEERLAAELAFSVRNSTNLSLIMLDVDHFKRVNDTFGHLAGDTVLKAVAWSLSQGIRTEDTLARYGGEEFVVLCREIDLPTATQVADRLRWSIGSMPINVGTQVIHVTTSAGVAALSDCGAQRDRETLLGLADQRLYMAKEGGRNRVVGGW